jgi:hypothetical protein
MREIEKKLARAWKNGTKFHLSNSDIAILPLQNDNRSIVRLSLFGNTIAMRTQDSEYLYFTMAGWISPTTTSRLNNVVLRDFNMGIYIKQGIPYLRGFGEKDVAINPSSIYRIHPELPITISERRKGDSLFTDSIAL